jgi:hypothetical protein
MISADVLSVMSGMARHAHTSPSDKPLESLAGSVARITFHSDDTGFWVLRVNMRDQPRPGDRGRPRHDHSPGESVDVEG